MLSIENFDFKIFFEEAPSKNVLQFAFITGLGIAGTEPGHQQSTRAIICTELTIGSLLSTCPVHAVAEPRVGMEQAGNLEEDQEP